MIGLGLPDYFFSLVTGANKKNALFPFLAPFNAFAITIGDSKFLIKKSNACTRQRDEKEGQNTIKKENRTGESFETIIKKYDRNKSHR